MTNYIDHTRRHAVKRLQDYQENTESHNRIIQSALRELEMDVIIQALIQYDEEEREIIYRNLSRRVYEVVTNELKLNSKQFSKSIQQKANETLLQKLNKYDEYYSYIETFLPENENFVYDHQYDDCPEKYFLALRQYIESKGVLQLNNILASIKEPFLHKGLELIVDGQDSLFIRSILDIYKKQRIRKLTDDLDMLEDAIESIANHESPIILQEKIKAYE